MPRHDRTMNDSSQNLPEAEDEAPVNAARVVLLQESTHMTGLSDIEWVLHRVHFVTKSEGERQIDAVTDGALRTTSTSRPLALLEAKSEPETRAMSRSSCKRHVRLQDGS